MYGVIGYSYIFIIPNPMGGSHNRVQATQPIRDRPAQYTANQRSAGSIHSQSEIGRLNTQPANQLKATDLTVSIVATTHCIKTHSITRYCMYGLHILIGCMCGHMDALVKIRVVYAYTGYIHLLGIHIRVTYSYWVCTYGLHTLTGYAHTGW